jgi:hypothetical protein
MNAEKLANSIDGLAKAMGRLGSIHDFKGASDIIAEQSRDAQTQIRIICQCLPHPLASASVSSS